MAKKRFTCQVLELKEANSFVQKHHRHNGKVIGYRFAIGAYIDDTLVGVAICGRPLSRHYNTKEVLEITRLCTDGTENACSFLYAKCVRIAREFGYKKVITYTLDTEFGASLKASGFTLEEENVGGNSKWKRTDRTETNSLFEESGKFPDVKKKRWVKTV